MPRTPSAPRPYSNVGPNIMSSESATVISFRHRSLLLLIILTWAISWPVIKIGVMTVPPIWFARMRYSRHFRASTMSMALLATPSLGMLISSLTLGEPVGTSLVAGMALTGVGIWLATSTSKHKATRATGDCL